MGRKGSSHFWLPLLLPLQPTQENIWCRWLVGGGGGFKRPFTLCSMPPALLPTNLLAGRSASCLSENEDFPPPYCAPCALL